MKKIWKNHPENPDEKIVQTLEAQTESVKTYFSKTSSLTGAKVCKTCRFPEVLQNEHLLANIGLDTAENEPFEFSYYGDASIPNSYRTSWNRKIKSRVKNRHIKHSYLLKKFSSV